jgi:hypothetical protein
LKASVAALETTHDRIYRRILWRTRLDPFAKRYHVLFPRRQAHGFSQCVLCVGDRWNVGRQGYAVFGGFVVHAEYDGSGG